MGECFQLAITLKRPGKTESVAVDSFSGAFPDAVGHALVPRYAVPGAAAMNTGIVATVNPGGTVSGRPSVVVMPAILGKFPHIAVYVVEAPGVGELPADWAGSIA
jgi:hypothetical protein